MLKYKKGDKVKGVITGIKDYGCFVMFDDGYTGLIHISEITKGFVNEIGEYFKLGDNIEAKIISVDEKEKKLNLSIKYRIGKKKKKKLEEIGHGFLPLEERLNDWIDEKINEIDGNN